METTSGRHPGPHCDEQTRMLFERHNLRCTTQRIALYEALRDCTTHPTAEQLYNLVRPRTGRLSLATVYNTLDALCSAGLARRIATTGGCCRFDADVSPHMHMRMTDTAELRDVPADLSERLLDELPREVLDEIEREMGVAIDAIHIQFTARSRGMGRASGDGEV